MLKSCINAWLQYVVHVAEQKKTNWHTQKEEITEDVVGHIKELDMTWKVGCLQKKNTDGVDFLWPQIL